MWCSMASRDVSPSGYTAFKNVSYDKEVADLWPIMQLNHESSFLNIHFQLGPFEQRARLNDFGHFDDLHVNHFT